MTSTVQMYVGDVRNVMSTLPDNAFDVLITSPPFLALRSYLPADHPDKAREIGSEPTPAAFLDTLYGLTAEWGRLIPEWGSICVELGDTMSGSTATGGDHKPAGEWTKYQRGDVTEASSIVRAGPGWPLAKSMCILPHAYTIGLAYGINPLTGASSPAGQWRIRNVITWARPNPPVGSLGKRNPERRTGDYKFRPACSYITVACRGSGRYFDLDAVRTDFSPNTNQSLIGASDRASGGAGQGGRHRIGPQFNTHAGAPPLDWHTDQLDGDWLWRLATAPYPGSHYATFPVTLPRRLIAAMAPLKVCTVCGWPTERIAADGAAYQAYRLATGDFTGPERAMGVNGARNAHLVPDRERETLGWTDCGHNAWRTGHVLDPFGGSGTTAVAAALEQRDCTLIDLDRRNVELVHRRLTETVRIVDRCDDGDTVTWTVEPASGPELVAIRNGQAGLFDEETP